MMIFYAKSAFNTLQFLLIPHTAIRSHLGEKSLFIDFFCLFAL